MRAMAGQKRKLPEDRPAGAPQWIVTFTDMVSLLVTFFVMMMSFSTIEEREELLITEAFSDASPGVVLNLKGHASVTPPEYDRQHAIHPMRGGLRPHVRPDDELLQNLEEMGQKASAEHLELDFAQAPDGLVIRFDRASAFLPGSAEVPAELRPRLIELARVLEHYGHLVVVEGFTDDAFQPTPRYPDAEALSAARASAAAEVMINESRLGPEVVQIAGLGPARPREGNDTAEGRTANRRVEVRVLSLSKARALQLETVLEEQRR